MRINKGKITVCIPRATGDSFIPAEKLPNVTLKEKAQLKRFETMKDEDILKEELEDIKKNKQFHIVKIMR